MAHEREGQSLANGAKIRREPETFATLYSFQGNRLEPLSRTEPTPELPDAEPRWPAFVAVLAAGGFYAAFPEVLTMGPRWLFPSIVLALLIPNVVSHHTGSHRLNTLIGFTVDAALTAGLIITLGLLVTALPTQK
jgi:hypothetical protein